MDLAKETYFSAFTASAQINIAFRCEKCPESRCGREKMLLVCYKQFSLCFADTVKWYLPHLRLQCSKDTHIKKKCNYLLQKYWRRIDLEKVGRVVDCSLTQPLLFLANEIAQVRTSSRIKGSGQCLLEEGKFLHA